MTKKMNLFVLLLLMVTNVAGQQLNLSGRVFEQKDNKWVVYIPFATVYYYNYEDTAKMEYCALTNLLGAYTLYNIHTGKYIVKVVAPGYQTKRQEVQFRDAADLAKKTNGQVYAHIAMKKEDNTQIIPTVFQAKDLVESEDDTVEKVVERLKAKVKTNTANDKKTYRIWLAGQDITTKLYNEMKVESWMKLAKELGDKSLKKTYIEFYDLSGKNRTLAEGVINIVFDGKSARPTDKTNQPGETTDFFIKK